MWPDSCFSSSSLSNQKQGEEGAGLERGTEREKDLELRRFNGGEAGGGASIGGRRKTEVTGKIRSGGGECQEDSIQTK